MVQKMKARVYVIAQKEKPLLPVGGHPIPLNGVPGGSLAPGAQQPRRIRQLDTQRTKVLQQPQDRPIYFRLSR